MLLNTKQFQSQYPFKISAFSFYEEYQKNDTKKLAFLIEM